MKEIVPCSFIADGAPKKKSVRVPWIPARMEASVYEEILAAKQK
jgi:hypothetical protein